MVDSNRNEWEFHIRSEELAEQCTKKVEHHKSRLKFWEGEQKAIREKYIASVQESAKTATEKEAREAEDLANQIDYMEVATAGLRTSNVLPPARRKEIMGDPDLYEELQKALSKVNEHKANVESYIRWENLLKRDGNGVLRKLSYNDAVFFGF